MNKEIVQSEINVNDNKIKAIRIDLRNIYL